MMKMATQTIERALLMREGESPAHAHRLFGAGRALVPLAHPTIRHPKTEPLRRTPIRPHIRTRRVKRQQPILVLILRLDVNIRVGSCSVWFGSRCGRWSRASSRRRSAQRSPSSRSAPRGSYSSTPKTRRRCAVCILQPSLSLHHMVQRLTADSYPSLLNRDSSLLNRDSSAVNRDSSALDCDSLRLNRDSLALNSDSLTMSWDSSRRVERLPLPLAKGERVGVRGLLFASAQSE